MIYTKLLCKDYSMRGWHNTFNVRITDQLAEVLFLTLPEGIKTREF